MEGAQLWQQIKVVLKPTEVEEARHIVGPALLESILDAENECKALEEILDLSREQVNEDMAKLDAKPALPAPPVLEYVEREIQFFVTQLRDHAMQHGLEPDAMIRPQTPKEESVLRYVSRSGTAGSSRPSTPGSGPMSRPSMAGSRPSTHSSGSRLGFAWNLSDIINPSKVGVASLQEKRTLEQLHAALMEERDALIQYAEDIRRWLDYEHEGAHEKIKETEARPPALADMREYSGRLQNEFLAPGPLATLLSLGSPRQASPARAKDALGGASATPAPKASTTLGLARAVGGATCPPGAAVETHALLANASRETPAAATASVRMGGSVTANDQSAKLQTEIHELRDDHGSRATELKTPNESNAGALDSRLAKLKNAVGANCPESISALDLKLGDHKTLTSGSSPAHALIGRRHSDTATVVSDESAKLQTEMTELRDDHGSRATELKTPIDTGSNESNAGALDSRLAKLKNAVGANCPESISALDLKLGDHKTLTSGSSPAHALIGRRHSDTATVVSDESAKLQTEIHELRVDHGSRVTELKTPIDTGSNESNAGALDSRLAKLKNAVGANCPESISALDLKLGDHKTLTSGSSPAHALIGRRHSDTATVVSDESAKLQTEMTELRDDHGSRATELKTPIDTGSNESNAGALDSRLAKLKNAVGANCPESISALDLKLGDHKTLTSGSSPAHALIGRRHSDTATVVSDESAKLQTEMTELRVDHGSRATELKTPIDTGSNESNAGALDSRLAKLKNAVGANCPESISALDLKLGDHKTLTSGSSPAHALIGRRHSDTATVVSDESAKLQTEMTELRVDHGSRATELKTPIDTGSNESNAGALDSRLAKLKNAVGANCPESISALDLKLGDHKTLTSGSSPAHALIGRRHSDTATVVSDESAKLQTEMTEVTSGFRESRKSLGKHDVSLGTIANSAGPRTPFAHALKNTLPSSFGACNLLHTMMCYACLLVPVIRGQTAECDAYVSVAELADSTILGQDWDMDWDAAQQYAVNIARTGATTQGLEFRSTRLDVSEDVTHTCTIWQGFETSHNGAAIYVQPDVAANIVNSSFVENVVRADIDRWDIVTRGGAIYASSSASIDIQHSSFVGNSVDDGGGAIYASSSASINIQHSSFVGNSAADDFAAGGAIYASSSASINIQHSSFVGNSADGGFDGAGDGGAIYASSSASINIQHSSFVGNSVGAGGAIYASSSASIDIQHSSFVGNSVGAFAGGAIYASSSASINIQHSSFVGNSALGFGDHIAANGPKVFRLYNVSIDPFVPGIRSVSLDVLAGCREYPCPPGFACSYANYSLFCSPCPYPLVGLDGLQCEPCSPGQGPSDDGTACIDCAGNTYSVGSGCESCPDGKVPSLPSRSACEACPVGTTSNARTAGRCGECEPGYFAFDSLSDESVLNCHACSSIIDGPGVMWPIKTPEGATIDAPECPGGAPGLTAGVCFLPGHYVHALTSSRPSTSDVVILQCESPFACVASARSSCSTTNANATVGAICGAGYIGPMCRNCDVGWTKINGRCVECPGYNFATFGLSCALQMATALFLLHKSTSSAWSASECRAIWNKVDTSRSGVLKAQGVQRVMAMMGIELSEERCVAVCTLEFRGRVADDAVLEVHVDDFVQTRSRASPTAALGTAIFFVQSFGLLLKDVSFISSPAEAMNLDPEEASGECVAQLSYAGRFFLRIFVMPSILFSGLLLVQPVWNFIRSASKQSLWERCHAPPRITAVHVQKGLLNTFLFTFAPLTRLAVQALVCVEPCGDDSEVCQASLAFDRGVHCFGSEHQVVSIVATAVLFMMVFCIPLSILLKTRLAIKQRKVVLGLDAIDTDQWFVELDVDGSGALEENELLVLNQRVRETFGGDFSVGPLLVKLRQSSGHLSKEEFLTWIHNLETQLLSTPFDILFGHVNDDAYWWFLQVLWVKTAVNVLFTLGYHGAFPWTVWMAMVMMASLLLLVLKQPYISTVDREVELFALVGLAAVSHIVSMFETGISWDKQMSTWYVYAGLTMILFVLPVLMFVSGTIVQRRAAKTNKQMSDDYISWLERTTETKLESELQSSSGKKTKIKQLVEFDEHQAHMVPPMTAIMKQGRRPIAMGTPAIPDTHSEEDFDVESVSDLGADEIVGCP